MFWEYSPSSVNLASDWLRAESPPVDERKKKKKKKKIEKKIDDGVARYFTRFGGSCFIC